MTSEAGRILGQGRVAQLLTIREEPGGRAAVNGLMIGARPQWRGQGESGDELVRGGTLEHARRGQAGPRFQIRRVRG